ncbi:hypothetical protein CTAYLR_005758 [Chrysophaeum taylorii]|uniref:Uncharacterized protein n=1 Tax=Chrysophaeum taylorii TaxID=2483200 RepID=A0AAD7UI24_9STRA|nr:hypothetical protein CTAYLR_005758 [Chrysophaeum taylorii]
MVLWPPDARDVVIKVEGARPATRIVSFCLFGDRAIYSVGAIQNAKLCPHIYPGWHCVFYVGHRVRRAVAEALLGAGAEVRTYDEDVVVGFGALLLRFLPAAETVTISRDADSRLNTREAAAVDEWIRSTALYHVMREPCHPDRIMGGMWAARGPIPDLPNRVSEFANKRRRLKYGDDMRFLEGFVPRHLAMYHTTFPPTLYKGFVGQPVNCVRCCDWHLFLSVGCPHVAASRLLPSELSTALHHQPSILETIASFDPRTT